MPTYFSSRFTAIDYFDHNITAGFYWYLYRPAEVMQVKKWINKCFGHWNMSIHISQYKL